MLFGSVTETNFEHPSNARSLMAVTLFGISIELRLEQPENVPLFIISIELGILKDERLLHWENALEPMLVTLFGTSMDTRAVQP